jgi:hypothetical protein
MGILSSFGFADDSQKQDPSKQDLETNALTEQTNRENRAVLTESYKKQSESSRLPVYTPPFLGAPDSNRLVGMAVRGINRDNLLLSVLTPEHTGITSQPQPILYWYLSKPVIHSYQLIEFVLNSETSVVPVLRKSIELPIKSGFHKISLADHTIYLQPDVEYTWSIALVKNPESRSLDVVSSGNVKYVEGSSELQARIKQSATDQRPFVYAQSGFWYESISELIEQIEQQPQNQRLPHNLMALLEQAGLQQVAVQMHHDLLDSHRVETRKE